MVLSNPPRPAGKRSNGNPVKRKLPNHFESTARYEITISLIKVCRGRASSFRRHINHRLVRYSSQASELLAVRRTKSYQL